MSRVLTIEDDETTANDIAVELRKRGFSVDWVNNGRGCKTCLPEERWPLRRVLSKQFDSRHSPIRAYLTASWA
jgi:CheY-like chemotaxis protein